LVPPAHRRPRAAICRAAEYLDLGSDLTDDARVVAGRFLAEASLID
jgi:hypothetical protein